jgi:uncharacterized protein with PQ loop repeat
MKAPWHHIRARKKHSQLKEGTKVARFIDKMIYVVAIATPLMTIPQVWEVWVNKTVMGVSIATWIGYLLASVCWLVYGKLHRDKPIIYTQTLWIIFSAMVVVGLMVYT